MQFWIRDAHRRLWGNYLMNDTVLEGKFGKCWRWCIRQCLLIGYILYIRKATRIVLLCARLQAKPWERYSKKCKQRVVRAVRARENCRCDFRFYGNKITYHRKLRQEAGETYGLESKYIESIIFYLR